MNGGEFLMNGSLTECYVEQDIRLEAQNYIEKVCIKRFKKRVFSDFSNFII